MGDQTRRRLSGPLDISQLCEISAEADSADNVRITLPLSGLVRVAASASISWWWWLAGGLPGLTG